MSPRLPTLDRRTLLIGGGIGVGLVVGVLLWPDGDADLLPRRPGEQGFGAFLKIGRDGRVTVAVPQVETGQGIWTGLPQVLADELGAAWETVAVEPAPLGGDYANPFATEWLRTIDGRSLLGSDVEGARITARSTSMRAFEQPFRDAGATGRAMLIAAAAERWNVDAGECDTADGFVIHRGGALGFGELAEEAAGASPASVPRRRGARLSGKALPRLDGPSKANGSFRFAGDVRLPGMLYAALRKAPPGWRVAGFAREAARSGQGVRALLDGPDWVAAVGDSWWAAEQALRRAGVTFRGPERGEADVRAAIEAQFEAGDERKVFSQGNYDSAIEGSRPLGATYWVAPAQHLGLEPLTATARIAGGQTEVWAPTLAPDLARVAAAEAAGIDAADVMLYPMPVGDSGGRALDADAIPLAVRLARALKRPVQLTYSQNLSQNFGHPAPAAYARMYARRVIGGLAAWRMRVATADGFGSTLRRMTGAEADGSLALLDGLEPPYSIEHIRIDAIDAEMPGSVGYLRGDPQRALTFFTESWIDELARIAGIEPLAFRMSMLGGNVRLAQCLAAAASTGGWDGGAPGSTMGLAACSAFGSHIGLLAEASLGPDQRIQVHRLVAAVDCGRIANPQLVRQQIEGGLLWALGTAVAPAPEWQAGVPVARSFASTDLPRIGDLPRIDVRLMPSNAAPGGVSGLSVPVLGPAIANAIHAGSGRRLRSLPFDPMAEA